MKILIFFIITTISFQSFGKSICVLSFFKSWSKEEGIVLRAFSYYKDAKVFVRPTLDDIRYCFSNSKFKEIIWLSHSTNSPIGSVPILVEEEGDKSRFLPIYPRFLRSLVKNDLSYKLKKLRLAACGIESKGAKVFGKFIEDLVDRGVEVDIAPTNKVLSQIVGMDVTSLNLLKPWLGESIDRSQLHSWSTDKNGYCELEFENTWENCSREQAKWVFPR